MAKEKPHRAKKSNKKPSRLDSARNPVDPAPSSLLPFDPDAPGAIKPSRVAVAVLALGVAGTLTFAALAIWSVIRG